MKVSGGEKQRLSIARALLRRPHLMVFDEATSSLDIPSERLIQDALQTLLADRTAIIIAHRLATIRDADRIVVIRQGRVQEQGSHGQLLAADGAYAALYRSHDQLAVHEQ